MPELAEVALMAVEVNRFRHHIFHAVTRSARAKLGPDLPLPRCWRTFRLQARSRGKEMRMDLWPVKIDSKIRVQEEKERQRAAKLKAAEAEAAAQQEKADASEEEAEEEAEASPQPKKRKRKTPALNGRGKPFTRIHAENPIIPLDGPLPLLFRMGMTGHIQSFPSHTLTHKHAHLTFLSSQPSEAAVCFVDQRQFGRWLVTDQWDSTRGPCPLTQYTAFRSHVLDRLDMRAMLKPLCEVLLDQRFFNGIGNYLRAEICHRAQVNPFASAVSVLAPLVGAVESESEPLDVLRLCHDVPEEVYRLGYRYGSLNNEEMKQQRNEDTGDEEEDAESQSGEAPEEDVEEATEAKEEQEDDGVKATVPAETADSVEDESEQLPPPPTKMSRKSFASWLRCYEKHNLGMLSTVDGLGRAMWHSSKYRVSGKSKAGSRRPRKGKTISGAEREADEEAETSSGRKRKEQTKKTKALVTKKAVEARQREVDGAEEEETDAAEAVRPSSRKRARAVPPAHIVSSGSRKPRRGAAAVSDSGEADVPVDEQSVRSGRRRSGRLAALSSGVEMEVSEAAEGEGDETSDAVVHTRRNKRRKGKSG